MTEHQDTTSTIPFSSPDVLPHATRKPSPYSSLDRMSMLVSSLGTLRLALMNPVNTHSSLDTADCTALAAFVTLLEEELERVIDELYPSREK